MSNPWGAFNPSYTPSKRADMIIDLNDATGRCDEIYENAEKTMGEYISRT
jgi:hypothetical protein